MTPLTAQDLDLRDFPYMPLDVVRLRDSETAVISSGDEFRAAVLLWCAAWHQVPAASLPADDRLLANLAGYGRDMKRWKTVREGALRGFIECDDGRLYHPVIAEKANEADTKRRGYADKMAKARAVLAQRRSSTTETIIDEQQPTMIETNKDHKGREGNRREGNRREGNRREGKEERKDSRAVATATRPSANEIFDVDFWKAYPKREGANPKAPARKKFFALVKSGIDPQAINAAARAYAAEIRKNKTEPRFIAQAITWLNQQRFEDYQPAQPAGQPTAPPGAPSDAELRERYGSKHHAVPAQTEAGSPEGTGADHAEELRPTGAGLRGDFGAGRVSDDQAGHPGVHRLGAVLPQPSGRTALRVSDAAGWPDRSDDGADAVAGMVRPELRGEPGSDIDLAIPEFLLRTA